MNVERTLKRKFLCFFKNLYQLPTVSAGRPTTLMNILYFNPQEKTPCASTPAALQSKNSGKESSPNTSILAINLPFLFIGMLFFFKKNLLHKDLSQITAEMSV